MESSDSTTVGADRADRVAAGYVALMGPEDFQVGMGLAGLDEHQIRRWQSWYRWTTLAMLAATFLTITATAEHARGPAPDGQIPLTRNEIGHLLATLIIQPGHDTCHRLR